MTAKTNWFENVVLEHFLRNNAQSAVQPYMALFIDGSGPGEAGGGTEVSGAGYARKLITFGAASGGIVTNSAAITFPTATGSWGTIGHYAIMDALTVGNMLYYGNLTAPKTIGLDDILEFPIGDLQVQEL